VFPLLALALSSSPLARILCYLAELLSFTHFFFLVFQPFRRFLSSKGAIIIDLSFFLVSVCFSLFKSTVWRRGGSLVLWLPPALKPSFYLVKILKVLPDSFQFPRLFFLRPG